MNIGAVFAVPALAVLLSFLIGPKPKLPGGWGALGVAIYIGLVGYIALLTLNAFIAAGKLGQGWKKALAMAVYLLAVILLTFLVKAAFV
ncbi:hypothetical protein [Burkholderia pseudomallei]|uniref:hypothetical protein n=1 Tax=Burkholderia pseudomallei TaxID=28450 RepID=UPI000F048A7C|nr:hypothetical protein [Burkholderia pseudomallei]MCW0053348.1 hypothetical protein [Burkholderia pseudomallei]VBU66120.1 Uncharacterised protein [Burkholderia pseudomallei]